jgi:hypothetical protein
MLASGVTGLRSLRLAASAGQSVTDRRGRGPALLCAAVWLVGASPSVIAAPANCAEVKAALEKRMQARGASAPVLLIVPRSLARGQRLVATCEDGTQKIIQRTGSDSPPAAGSGESSGTSVRQPLP